MEQVFLWIVTAILMLLILSFILLNLFRNKGRKNIESKYISQYSEKPRNGISAGNCAGTTPDQDYSNPKAQGYHSDNC